MRKFLSCTLLCIGAAICYTMSLSGSVPALLIQQQLVWQRCQRWCWHWKLTRTSQFKSEAYVGRWTPAALISQKGLKQFLINEWMEEKKKKGGEQKQHVCSQGLWLNCSLHLQAASVCSFHAQDLWDSDASPSSSSVAHIFQFLMRCYAHAAPSLRLPAPSDNQGGQTATALLLFSLIALHARRRDEMVWPQAECLSLCFKTSRLDSAWLSRCCLFKLGVNQ